MDKMLTLDGRIGVEGTLRAPVAILILAGLMGLAEEGRRGLETLADMARTSGANSRGLGTPPALATPSTMGENSVGVERPLILVRVLVLGDDSGTSTLLPGILGSAPSLADVLTALGGNSAGLGSPASEGSSEALAESFESVLALVDVLTLVEGLMGLESSLVLVEGWRGLESSLVLAEGWKGL